MGFQVPFGTFTIEFPEETGLTDLVVVGRMVSIGDYFTSLDLDGDQMIEWFADNALEWWNVEVDGVPVPTTKEGMLSLPRWLVTQVVRRWQRGIATVDGPLARTSSGGAPSPALNLPMEVLSPNPES